MLQELMLWYNRGRFIVQLTYMPGLYAYSHSLSLTVTGFRSLRSASFARTVEECQATGLDTASTWLMGKRYSVVLLDA